MLIQLLPFVFFTGSAFAQNIKTDAGLGFTNNARLTSNNTKSDFFLRASGQYSWKEQEHKPKLRLSYTDYFSVSSNDMLAWSIDDTWSPTSSNLKEWIFKGSLFGRHYTSSSPGITEESFSHIGVSASGDTKFVLKPKLNLIWGPRAGVRKYIQNSSRTDISAGVGAAVDFEIQSDLTVGTFANFEMAFSNQSAYSRYIFDLGINADYNIKRDWNWFSEVLIRQTNFTSRTVGTVTETTTSRGRNGSVRKTTSTTDNESFSGFDLFSQINHQFRRDQTLSGEVTLMTQGSTSGLQDYSAMELFIRWSLVF